MQSLKLRTKDNLATDKVIAEPEILIELAESENENNDNLATDVVTDEPETMSGLAEK